ncbi:MAG: flagellar basal body-associated FliL family protein [Terriglobia bacterium]
MAEPETPAPAAANAAGPEVSKKKSKLLLIVIVLVVLLALGGGGYLMMSRRAMAGSKKAQPKVDPDAPPAAMVPLDSFLVNLADPGRQAFLRVGISLALSKPPAASSEGANELAWIPEVRDSVLAVLTTWQSTDLLAPGGKKKLKAQLLSALQQRMPQLGITGVYFTDFLIQQ